jgi:hypothetical protein
MPRIMRACIMIRGCADRGTQPRGSTSNVLRLELPGPSTFLAPLSILYGTSATFRANAKDTIALRYWESTVQEDCRTRELYKQGG